jgi:hypothetical protein
MSETLRLHRGVTAFRRAVVEPELMEEPLPLSEEALLAARVEAELDRCVGLMFTATPTQDLVEVARWQLIEDRAWAGKVRYVVATTCRMSREERDFAGDEMALAWGLSPGEGKSLVWHYGELASLPGLLESVEAGRLTRRHVEALLRALNETGLTAEQRQAAVLICLARWNGQTPGEWTRMLRRLALSIDPKAAERRKKERTQGRRVAFYPRPDEQGGMWLEAPLEQVAAAQARIDAEARRLKAAGDERTMDQLRCDVTLELLTYGTINGEEAAPWTVAVVVPLSVLEGGDFEVAEIPGFGPILPSTARDLAAQAGRFEQIAAVSRTINPALSKGGSRATPKGRTRRTCCARRDEPVGCPQARALLVLVVEAGEPGGDALDRHLELGVLIDELLEPLGEPSEGHLLLTPSLSELLETAVGEVHQREKTASTSEACSASCTLLDPAAGEAAARRDRRRSRTSVGRCSGRESAMWLQAPMLAGSSCTHTTSVAFG